MCGKGSNTSTTTSQNTVPQWLQDKLQSVSNTAENVAATPYNPATQKSVAGFSGDQNQAFQDIRDNQGAWQPFTNAASGYAAAAGSPINNAAIANYMNPYTDSVISSTLGNINQQNQIQANNLRGNAASMGALGNDRVNVAEAELARNQDLAKNQTVAGLLSQNFSQALSAAQQDRSAFGNAANLFGQLGNQVQNLGSQDASNLLKTGGLQQQLGQQVLDTNSANAQAQTQYPFSTTGWLQGILTGQSPTFASNTSTQTSPGTSSLSTLLGLGSLAYGLSDPRMKSDGGVVGSLHDGTPIHAFKYKPGVATAMGAPGLEGLTHFGPMATEVHPADRASLGGLKFINPDKVAARQHMATGGSASPGPFPQNDILGLDKYGGIGGLSQLQSMGRSTPGQFNTNSNPNSPSNLYSMMKGAMDTGKMLSKPPSWSGESSWGGLASSLGNSLGSLGLGMARGGMVRQGYEAGGDVGDYQPSPSGSFDAPPQYAMAADQAVPASPGGNDPYGTPVPPSATQGLTNAGDYQDTSGQGQAYGTPQGLTQPTSVPSVPAGTAPAQAPAAQSGGLGGLLPWGPKTDAERQAWMAMAAGLLGTPGQWQRGLAAGITGYNQQLATGQNNALQQRIMQQKIWEADRQAKILQQRDAMFKDVASQTWFQQLPSTVQKYAANLDPDSLAKFAQEQALKYADANTPQGQADLAEKRAKAALYNANADQGRIITVPAGATAVDRSGRVLYQGSPDDIRSKTREQELGKIDAGNIDKQRAGVEVIRNLRGLGQMADEAYTASPDAFNNAIGAFKPDGFQKLRQFGTPESWNLFNRMNHQIEGLTTAFMAAASSKGMNMSDARMQKFEDAMGAMRNATTKEEFDKIVHDAEGIIRSIFVMPPLDDAAPVNIDTPKATPVPKQGLNPSKAPTQRVTDPARKQQLLNEANEAIRQGAPRDQVIKRLREQHGIEVGE